MKQVFLGLICLASVLPRGFPGYQCPLCNWQVAEFVKNGPEFAKAGARVAAVLNRALDPTPYVEGPAPVAPPTK